MDRQETEIFRGIFKRLGYFEIPEMEWIADEEQEILDSYSSESLPDALNDLTAKIIRHIEVISDPADEYKKRMIS